MDGRRKLVERSDDEAGVFEITAATSLRGLAWQAGRSAGFYAGIVTAAGAVIWVLAASTAVGKNTLSRTWRIFEHTIQQYFVPVTLLFVPLAVLVGLVTFGLAIYRNRRLATRYSVAVDGGELRCREQGPLGDREGLRVSFAKVLDVQQTPITDSSFESVLTDGARFGVTVMTVDGMYTFGEGLGEGEAGRAVERLETAIFGR